METPSQGQMTGQPYLPFEKDQERKSIFTALNIKELKNFRISSLILYFLAYFYTVASNRKGCLYWTRVQAFPDSQSDSSTGTQYLGLSPAIRDFSSFDSPHLLFFLYSIADGLSQSRSLGDHGLVR